MRRQRYVHLDSTGRDQIAESFEPLADSIDMVLRTGVGDNGRSPWVWLRLENGDLFLATAPRGSTYEELEHDHSDGEFVDSTTFAPDPAPSPSPWPKRLRLECTFRPQAWVNDNAIPVDGPELPATWQVECDLSRLPQPRSHETDALRQHPDAPQWVRDWQGPFEVDYTVVGVGQPA